MPGLFKTSNPALNAKTFEGRLAEAGEAMTLQGTINKAGFLLFCVSATAAWTWWLARTQAPRAVLPWMLGGLIVGFIFSLVTIFKKEWSPVTAPIYALCQGLAPGGLSVLMEQHYPGIALQALGLTFGVTLAMLVLYTSGLLRATT